MLRQVSTLLTDLEAAPPQEVCAVCRKPFNHQYEVYRCADCEISFHRDCMRNVHFKEQIAPSQIHEFQRLQANNAAFAAENALLHEEVTELDRTARELLDNARKQIVEGEAAASRPADLGDVICKVCGCEKWKHLTWLRDQPCGCGSCTAFQPSPAASPAVEGRQLPIGYRATEAERCAAEEYEAEHGTWDRTGVEGGREDESTTTKI